jgi:hypothetical protein
MMKVEFNDVGFVPYNYGNNESTYSRYTGSWSELVHGKINYEFKYYSYGGPSHWSFSPRYGGVQHGHPSRIAGFLAGHPRLLFEDQQLFFVAPYELGQVGAPPSVPPTPSQPVVNGGAPILSVGQHPVPDTNERPSTKDLGFGISTRSSARKCLKV